MSRRELKSLIRQDVQSMQAGLEGVAHDVVSFRRSSAARAWACRPTL